VRDSHNSAIIAGMASSYLSMIEQRFQPVNQRATLEARANAPARVAGH
jgi:hypothetical protein